MEKVIVFDGVELFMLGVLLICVVGIVVVAVIEKMRK